MRVLGWSSTDDHYLGKANLLEGTDELLTSDAGQQAFLGLCESLANNPTYVTMEANDNSTTCAMTTVRRKFYFEIFKLKI